MLLEANNVEEYDIDQGIEIYTITNQGLHSTILDQWRNLAKMSTRRHKAGVAVLGNLIYVTGGFDCNLAQNTVDCYHPDSNIWSPLANLNIARAGHSLVSLHGRLYAIGGRDVDSVEVYDPDNNTWTLLQHKLDGRLLGTGAGLIKKYHVV